MNKRLHKSFSVYESGVLIEKMILELDYLIDCIDIN